MRATRQALYLTLFALTASSQTQVTLSTAVSPSSGQPGVTSITLTGSGFPAGTIQPASVTVSLSPAAGGTAATTPATSVTTVVGSTLRIAFIIPAAIAVTTPTSYLVSISGATTTGTAFASSNKVPLTVNPLPSITSISPNSAQLGQSVIVTITAAGTTFVQGSTRAAFGSGVSVAGGPDGQPGIVTVTSPTTATVSVKPNATAATGPRDVLVQTGAQTETALAAFTVNPVSTGSPTVTSFTPPSVSIGGLVTVAGTNLAPAPGASAQVAMAKQGGGTILAPVGSVSATSLTFTVPAGATTGPFSITVNGGTATSATPLTVTPSTNFTLAAAPAAANLIQGQSVTIAATLASSTGFDQLAALSVSGVPSGLTAAFNPTSITAGQTAILTLTAPATQPIALSTLTLTASATVQGFPVSQSAVAQVSVQAPTTSFLGKTVVSDSLETPLAGVTVSMLGKDGNGNTTGCTGTTVSDGAGNFALLNLSAMCVGPQLIGFSGLTVTSPTGTYAGVNLAFTLTRGQVTASPILVHLPRIDNAETFYVQQNYATDQSYSYQTIPGLSVTAYAHTTFTMPDGTKPNPFPLAAVNVPVDRLPALKPQVPTMLAVFIVAFQPANATTNQPVAVYYPNTVNTPAGSSTSLMTLDPTHGVMVPYGTATVSNDGTQFVPDMDPVFPGHRYGLVHFDWHMVGTPPGNQTNPCGFCPIARKGDPVDLSSGLATINETDISYGGARGTISITRNYRNAANQPSATQYGPFGFGTNHNWGYELDSVSPSTASVINLIMPDGNRFAFSKQANGTFINSGIPSMGGGVMTVSGNNVSLRWKDGTTFGFLVIFNVPILRTLLDSVTDANGNKFQIIHNGFQIQAIADPTGRSLLFNYNTGGHITQITAPDGSNVSYDYRGDDGPVLRQVRRTDGSIVQYSYDVNNGLTSVTDNFGAVFASNTYDANQRVIQQRQANGGILQFAYTLQNPLAGILSPVLATTVTDALNHQTTYRFAPNGALIGVTDALGQTRTISRDGGNYIVGLTGTGVCPECGNTEAGDQSFSYDDSTGNLRSHTDALGNTTTFDYDPVFNKVTLITDPLGDTTSFTYDSRGNLLSQTDPNNNVTSFQYDKFGELVQTTDPTNQKTAFAYDSFGNVITVTDPLNNSTLLQYDANGRVTATTDALGKRSSIAYDGSNRITSQKNPQGGVTGFVYDERGNLLSVTDARGKKTSFTYDLMDGLLTRNDPIGRTDTRTYDLDENLIQFQDRGSQTSKFTYDAVNRLTAEAYQDGSTVAHSYDANSRLATVNDSSGGAFGFAYDLAGRLTNSTTSFGAVNYVRDALGRATSRQVMGQPAVAYAYDKAGNLLSAATAAASVNRTYNSRNLVSNVARMNGVSSQYGYDQVGRLATLTHTGSRGVINAQTYSYDATGNRTGATNSTAQSLATQPVATAIYDADNEQAQFGTTNNTFDANGSLNAAAGPTGSATYTWDSRHRLISVSTPGGQVTTFIYDFAGNLLQQKDVGPIANVTQTFVLDDLTNVTYVNRSDGDQYSVLSGQWIDDHMAVMHNSGALEYGLTDAVNSTIVTVDQTGAAKGQFFYDPFGQTTTSNSTYPFQYTGRSLVSTSLYYYRARYYSPPIGRFISEDPASFSGGDANLYRYVWNSSPNLVDPVGLAGWPGRGAAWADQQASLLADTGHYWLAAAEYFASDLIRVNPLLSAIDTVTDPCKSVGERGIALGLLAFTGLGAYADMSESPTALFYAPLKGWGWSRSTMGQAAWGLYWGVKWGNNFSDAREALMTGNGLLNPEGGCGCK